MFNLQSRFKNLPIKRKIISVILLTCVTAQVVAALAIFANQLITFRNTFTRDLKAIASIIAHNSTSALAFKDRQAAQEMLASLKAKPHILYASIQRLDGSELAAFNSRELSLPALPAGDGLRFVGPYLVLTQPVLLTGERIGTMRLVSNFQDEYRRSFVLYGEILTAVLLASVVLALVLSDQLQRLISQPILALAATAQTVGEKQDYSLRAEKFASDEVGRLTDALNGMLGRIQSDDGALREANHSLQREVGHRKRTEAALQESRQRYEVAVLGSSDGLWDWDLAHSQYYYSPRWKGMLGYDEWELEDCYQTWETRLHPEDRDRVLRFVDDYLQGKLPAFEIEFRFRRKDQSYVWILSRGAALRDEQGKPFRFAGSHTDITARKDTEQEVERLHKELLTTSRHAGMAEVASGVLHNVGNVLNSVNVSVNMLNDSLGRSQAGHLAKACSLLDAHRADLGSFLTTDPKGKRVPEFLSALAISLAEERETSARELQTLSRNVEHIKEIVAMQQSYAKVAGVLEDLPAPDLVEDALRMNAGAFVRHNVQVKREYLDVPPVRVDRHKVLQILINLFRNAKYAMDAANPAEKVLRIGVALNGVGRVEILVNDNGIGIARENLTRIFSHGFTTKGDGHGFGLHSGALAAKEMGGSLQAFSDGPGAGATFILELPVAPTDHTV